MDYYISDRRWKKCIHLLQASAFLNGRSAINNTDIPILIHCLWNTTASIPTIVDVVTGSLVQKLHRQMDQIEKAIDQALKQVSQHEPEESRSVEEEFGGLSLFYYHISNYPLGKCMFFKTDYAHLSTNSDIDGILYRDKQKDALIVRAIYSGAPFDYQIKGDSNVNKVKLRKCNGGVIIDGIPYAFKRLNPIGSPSLFNNKNLPTSSITDTALTTLKSKVVTDLQGIKDLFRVENLFLSDDDKKMAKKYLTSCEKRTKELEVKVMNAKELL
jgi:MoxR-like ATPase